MICHLFLTWTNTIDARVVTDRHTHRRTHTHTHTPGYIAFISAVTEMLVNVLSLKDDDLVEEGDEKIKPGSGKRDIVPKVAHGWQLQ